MGTFQMAILLGFNNSTILSIKDLQETTQLPEKELIKQVQSLLEAKLLLVSDKSANSAIEANTNDSKTSSSIVIHRLFYLNNNQEIYL